MDYTQAFAISAAGMSAERTRMEVAAMNLAHANTAAPLDAVYRPRRVVVLPSVALSSGPGFDALLDGVLTGPSVGIAVVDRPARRALEPGHPQADAQGFVAYPGVDAASEMVSIMAATRAYEANVVAMNAARHVALKCLEIGA